MKTVTGYTITITLTGMFHKYLHPSDAPMLVSRLG